MRTLDIEIYDEYGKDENGEQLWAQAHYLVHGWDDLLWTNNKFAALAFLQESLEKIEEEKII